MRSISDHPRPAPTSSSIRRSLLLVKEKMDVTICVSPEAGWGELETFLAGTRSG